ncbi:MAG TPA: response regulator [Anaeromyxobacteraceae bacterium]|nr:response regulator [Anaeromyxobacteraceae bacterium]
MRHYLVVDDNRAFAENLAEIVGDDGDDVCATCDEAQALRLAGEHRFDVLVTDLRMPHMNGAELVQRARRVDPGVSAIAVTAYLRDRDLVRKEGLLAALPKPVPVNRLLDLMRSARRDGLAAVVEDDAAPCEELWEALRRRGFAVVSAASVLAAERLGPVMPFCALVDPSAPDRQAGEAVRELSRKHALLPMLVLPQRDRKPPALGAGFPLSSFDAILEAVERLYRSRPEARE